jgi:hypothetical protein
VEVVVLEDPDMVETALDHRVWARLTVLLQQMPLKTSGIDPDADGAAMVPRRTNDFAHPVGGPDVAGVDPQAGSTGLRRLDRALVVEMYIGHDRDGAFPHDLAQGRR